GGIGVAAAGWGPRLAAGARLTASPGGVYAAAAPCPPPLAARPGFGAGTPRWRGRRRGPAGLLSRRGWRRARSGWCRRNAAAHAGVPVGAAGPGATVPPAVR